MYSLVFENGKSAHKSIAITSKMFQYLFSKNLEMNKKTLCLKTVNPYLGLKKLCENSLGIHVQKDCS